MIVPSRREQRREQDINYILDVAERLFAEKGFVRVTMSELAQKAEFALGTIYSFFEGKRQLYHRLMDRKVGEYVAAVRSAMRSEVEPLRRLEKFIEAKLTFAHQNRPFIRLHLTASHEPLQGDSQRPSTKRRGADQRVLLRELADVFRRGIASGVFAKADPNVLAVALDGLTTALAASWLTRSSRASPAAEIETAKVVFLRGVLATAPPA